MKVLEYYYRRKGKEVPYYAKYSLMLIIWRPIRKYLNVVVIPNIPFSGIRVAMYRLIGFKIGKNTFIGMKCYLDDTEPSHTVIGSNVTISYGCYFALHGKGQDRLFIEIQNKVYIGMRCNIIASKENLIIGKESIIGAASLVNKSIPANEKFAGVPVKKLL